MSSRLLRIVGFAATVCITLSRGALAQRLRGVVRDSSAGTPVLGAVVSVIDSAGVSGARTITDGAGAFVLPLPGGGARLRFIRIGYRPVEVKLVLPADTLVRVTMARLPAQLAAMRVSGRELCPGSDDRGPAFQLWEQARAGLLATVVAREANPAQATSLTYKRRFAPGNDLVHYLESREHSGATTRPFVASAPAAEFARVGYMSEDASGRTYFAPDADVLLDESFATTHCFRLAGDDTAHQGQVGLAFIPAPGRGRDTIVDVTGVIWIDRVTPALRSLDFRYTNLEPPARDLSAGGHLEFVAVANGVSFVERWALRLVLMEVSRTRAPSSEPSPFLRQRRQDRRDIRAVAIEEAGGQVLSADWPDGVRWRAPATGIAGRVVQTDAGLPVKHALVALDGSADTLSTDTTGAFSIVHMIPGRYTIVAADTTIAAHVPPRRVMQVVEVPRDRIADVRLKVPPLTDILGDLCKDKRREKNTTAIVGRVTMVGAQMPAGAAVFAKWQADYRNLSIASGDGPRRSEPPVEVITASQESSIDSDGRFLLCGVAPDRPIQLRLAAKSARLSDTTVYVREGTFSSLDWLVRQP